MEVLGRPTLLESNDAALLDKLRKELAEVFSGLAFSYSINPKVAMPPSS
jgi:hypothetical protein